MKTALIVVALFVAGCSQNAPERTFKVYVVYASGFKDTVEIIGSDVESKVSINNRQTNLWSKHAYGRQQMVCTNINYYKVIQ